MDFAFGRIYERSATQTPESFVGSLADFVNVRLSGLPLALRLVTGETVVGRIDAISASGVTLERGDESLIGRFASDTIAAFVLVDEALDRSDELRAIG
jgi:hypothetical protein